MEQQETYSNPESGEYARILSRVHNIMPDFEQCYSDRRDVPEEFDIGYACGALVKVVSVITRYFLYLNEEEQDEVLDLLMESLQEVKTAQGETKRMLKLWRELYKYQKLLVSLDDDGLLEWKKHEE